MAQCQTLLQFYTVVYSNSRQILNIHKRKAHPEPNVHVFFFSWNQAKLLYDYMCQRPLRSWVKASVSNVVFAFVIHAFNASTRRKEGSWVQRQVMCLIEFT